MNVPPANATLRLFLIRHGQTEWSLSGRHTGTTDIPLSATGEENARRLQPFLKPISFSHVFTSPRQRARRTCELAGLGATAEVEPDLAEWNYGDYEGRRSAEILANHPGWNLFRDGCPGGESPGAVADRADRLLARLRSLDGHIALFSHGHFGRMLAARWINLSPASARGFLLDTASISVFGYEHNRTALPVIALLNQTARPGE